ncbi:hypothetical protein AZI87_00905 [Bdellovibrio bacteriovorus]|uniref:Uncharacterized protein n=1 Tax=Bdellovibrio bacteriovorus TaxID=959 RepID=A0A162GDB2_BDEBC|nr:hypothetical protein [Bdellovibrio bacteriovorus]KYG67867.1 hypothetical protein AZI87_00905 [Bdellovibrio bacteriovorus]
MADLEKVAEETFTKILKKAFRVVKHDANGEYEVLLQKENLPDFFGGMLNFVAICLEEVCKSSDEDLTEPMKVNLLKTAEFFRAIPISEDSPGMKESVEIFQMQCTVLAAALNEKIDYLSLQNLCGDISKIHSEYLKNGSLISCVDVLIREQAQIPKMIDRWGKSKVLSDRMLILTKALKAHIDSHFELSIPIFLIHIEAIFAGLFSGKNAKKRYEDKKKIARQIIAKKNVGLAADLPFAFTGHVLQIVIDEILSQIDMDPEGDFPNRHAVVHGQDLNYFTDPYASTRCILILDSLSRLPVDDFKARE